MKDLHVKTLVLCRAVRCALTDGGRLRSKSFQLRLTKGVVCKAKGKPFKRHFNGKENSFREYCFFFPFHLLIDLFEWISTHRSSFVM